nr:hypothetical protein [Actinomycetota bacterium]
MDFLNFLPVLVATSFAIYLSLVDIREMRIPNRILFPGILITSLTILSVALLRMDLWRAILAIFGGVISAATFFMIHLLKPKGLGMGDVKFAGLIGIALSWISFPSGLIGLGIAFIASSIYSILVFVVKRDRFQRIIPFAPFMLLGLLFVE